MLGVEVGRICRLPQPQNNFEWVQDWMAVTLIDKRTAEESHNKSLISELTHQLRVVVRTIKELLSLVLPVEKLTYSYAQKSLVLKTTERSLRVSQLSDGTRAILAMVADLAHRCVRLNPHLKDPTKETPGLVLIDEIDLHLHPEWQQIVLSQLTKAFPKVQFIVSSHSPQVLSTVSRDQIRILDASQTSAIIPTTETYGSRASTPLETVFSVSSRPPLPVVAELRTYMGQVQRGRGLDAASQELRTKLETALGVEDPDLMRSAALLARQQATRGGSA